MLKHKHKMPHEIIKARQHKTAKTYIKLYQSITEGDLVAVKTILQQKKVTVDVNIIVDQGWTPLHLAVYYKYFDVTQELLKHGANITSVNANGHTSFDLAINNNDLATILLLWKHGANHDEIISKYCTMLLALYEPAIMKNIDIVPVQHQYEVNVDPHDSHISTIGQLISHTHD